MTAPRALPAWTLTAALVAGADGAAQPAAGAARETVRLTLAEAVDRARAHSPRLEELRALQQAADAERRGARAERLPQVELRASYARRSEVPELTLALPGRPPQTVFPNLPNEYRTQAALALPVYTSGRIAAQVAAAEHQLRAAERDVEAGLGDLLLETVTAYWSLVAARESERVLSESLAAFEADLKQVRDRQAVGVAARSDVLNVQVERDRAELSRLEAHNEAEAANVNLLRLLGLGAGVAIEPTEPVTAPAPPGEDVEALVAAALERRPEIAGLRARAAAAEAGIKAARAASGPQATVSAGYDYARPNPRVLPLSDAWDRTWSVGVSVSLLAFDGGRTGAAAAAARARAEAARHRLGDLERRVRLEVTARSLDLSTRRAALEVAERSLEAARENVRVSQDRYREGLIPVAELLDAQTRLLRSGLDRTASATLLQQARASLDRAVGVRGATGVRGAEEPVRFGPAGPPARGDGARGPTAPRESN
jgi:outer membrane protein